MGLAFIFWRVTDDDRLANLPEQPKLSVSRAFMEALLTEGYPSDDYPEIESIQDALERAGADIVRQRRHGGMPPDIFRSLRDSAQSQGGLLPLLLIDGGDALLQPTDDGGVRISTHSVSADEAPGVETDVMDFADLTDDEVRERTAGLDGDDLVDWVLRLTQVRPDLDLPEALAQTWARSDVPLAEVFALALEEGLVDEETLSESVEEAVASHTED